MEFVYGKISWHIQLSEVTEFLKEVVRQYKSASQHYFLSDFLQAIGKKYQERKDGCIQYLIDLLKLGVSIPNLLSGKSTQHGYSLVLNSTPDTSWLIIISGFGIF